ncbi:MAG TPA: ATP-binding protein [Flavobacterium sp.]|nr:ATP-binding protein [Flavobacterium sp.]
MSSNTKNSTQFLSGGGEMGMLTRAKDWSKTPVGAVEYWPQSLRTTVGILLNSKFPMFLFWGPELICFYNDAYRPSLGENGKHPDILGEPGEKYWLEIWAFIKPLIDRVLAGEATWNEDQFLPIFRNGKTEDVYWTFSYSPVIDESGKPAGVFVTCTETTEKVISLKKLSDSCDQLEFAIEAAELGTWEYNPKTDKFTGNERLKSWFGLQSEAAIELPLALAAIADKDRQNVIDAIQNAMDYTSGGHYDIEYSVKNPITNKEIIVLAKGRAWFDDNKEVHRFNGIMQDVTQQVMARKKIEESERYMRLMIMQAPVAICILRGPDSIFETVNPLMEAMMGRSAEAVEGRNIFDAMPELRNHGLEELLENILQTGESFIAKEQQFELPRGNDLKVHFITYIYEAMKTTEGVIDGVMVVAIDVTEQKLFKENLENLIQERTRQLELKNIDLEKMNKELQSFAYISSHDLQEPLRKIQTFSSLMMESERNNLSDQGQHYFQRMQLAAQRMQTLIDDLLAYSRTNKKENKFELTRISQIVEEIKSDLQEEIAVRNAIIEETGDAKLKIIPFQFRQLMQNLISNAMKFSKPGQDPHIKIASGFETGAALENENLQPDQLYCHISISDNGIGFPPEFSEKIFELFQRLHSKDQYMGTGIGLAIVKKIVENHNGTITATGGLGKGAQFDIYIPKA